MPRNFHVLENQKGGESVTLRWIFGVEYGKWIKLAQDCVQIQALI
jgi:hypothetical protein